MSKVGIFAASSQTGLSCLQTLLKKYQNTGIRAIYRSEIKSQTVFSLSGAKEAISNQRLEVVTGVDAYDTASLDTAFDGVDVVVVVTPHDPSRGFADDAMLTKAMIGAAVSTSSVKHIINVGSWTVHEPERVSMIANRFVSPEKQLQQLDTNSKITWTSLRCGFFNSNFVKMAGPSLQSGNIFHFPKNCAFAPVDPRDIGKVAAAVCATAGVGHENTTYEISGPQMLSASDLADVFGRALDRPSISLEHVDAKDFGGSNFPPPLRELMVYLEARGDTAIPFSKDVEQITGEPACEFETWVKEHKAKFNPTEDTR